MRERFYSIYICCAFLKRSQDIIYNVHKFHIRNEALENMENNVYLQSPRTHSHFTEKDWFPLCLFRNDNALSGKGEVETQKHKRQKFRIFMWFNQDR